MVSGSGEDRGSRTLLWGLAAVAVAAALALGVLAWQSGGAEQAAPEQTRAGERPADGAAPTAERQGSDRAPEVQGEVQGEEAPSESSPGVAAPAPAPARPQCTEDAECRGPKTASCIEVSCVEGQCERDLSGCECQSNADCDDGRECTRDLCFSSTKACIFIDEGCP